MKLQEITIANFGSFTGEHKFRLADRGLVIVLGDNADEIRMNSNGSGKSTLFDSLDWCLFGKVPKGDSADSVISDHAGKDLCEVTVELEDDDGSHVMVRRWRGSTNGLMLVVDGEELTKLDTKETQTDIEAILGLDRDVFHAAVLFGQTDLFRFADSTSDVERMDILTKILQLSEIDEWAERAKELRNETTQALHQFEVEMVSTNAKICALEGEIPSYDRQSTQWETERAESLRSAVQALDGHRTSIAEYEKVVAKKATVESNLEAARAHAPIPLDLSAFDEHLSELRYTAATYRGDASALISGGKSLNIQIEQMQRLGAGDCSRCGQPITAEHIAKEVQALSVRRDDLREAYKVADQAASQAEAVVQKTEAEREENRRLHYEADKAASATLQEALEHLKTVQQSEEYLRKAVEYVGHLQKTMVETQAKVNPWSTRRGETQATIGAMRAVIVENQEKTHILSERGGLLDFWVTAFGPKGLKNYILDSKLQEMTDAANQWVSVLTGGTVWVRFETQKLGKSSKALRNNLNVRVFRYNPDGSISERNYKSWSGGEKQRVSLGIDFGLSRLIAKRSAKSWDVLILDELFKHLDQSGREAVVEMLQQLRREKSSVFCIDHDSTFQGAFEHRVVIQKQNGQSRILEENNAPEEKPVTKKKRNRVPARHPVSKGSRKSADN